MRVQPLHSAVAARNAEIVRLLIAAGADVNARQQDDFTPLMAARQNGDAEIEQMLLDAGATA
jgi:ankyrin repeat protein